MSMFQKATKTKSKLRAALFGPSGSGKTMTALRMAAGMGKRVAVIDTEHGSASKYSDRFDFDVCELGNEPTIDQYIAAMNDAGDSYDVLIIDSMSHAWQSLMDEVDKLANAKYRGNGFAAWREGTPKQRKFVQAILTCKAHLIATMRSKTEWSLDKDARGKTTPTRVGLAPDQGKGIEYEFDLLMEISPEHYANVTKDRTGKFQDKAIEKPGEEFGKALAEWLSDGVERPSSPPVPPAAAEPPPAAPVALLKDGEAEGQESEAQVTLTEMREGPSGTANGKAWQIHEFVADDGTVYATLDTVMSEQVAILGFDSPYIITYTPIVKNGKLNRKIIKLIQVPAESAAVSDDTPI